VPGPRNFAAATRDLIEFLAQICDQRAHGPGVLGKIG
jgi:hypothetical protein